MSDARTVLISGAASGLGLALAQEAGRRGWRVALADIQESRGEAALRTLTDTGVEAMFLRCDIRQDVDVRVAVQRVSRRWGRLDLLVNNAGVASTGLFEALSDDDWRWHLDTNLLGTVRSCRAAVSEMQRQGAGQIVNIAALDGVCPAPGQSSEAACAAAIMALSESLRSELAPLNIKVSVALVPPFRSNLGEQLRSTDAVSRARYLRAMGDADDNSEQLAREIFEGIEKQAFLITNQQGRSRLRSRRWRPKRFFEDMKTLAARIRR